MSKPILLAVAIVASCSAAPSAEAQSPPPASARRDIAGYWHYNQQASDNPSTAIPRDTAGRGEGGGLGGGGRRGGMGGGGRGSGGRGGRGGGGGMGGRPGMSEAGRERSRQTVQLALDAPNMLRISRNDSMVTLVNVAIG